MNSPDQTGTATRKAQVPWSYLFLVYSFDFKFGLIFYTDNTAFALCVKKTPRSFQVVRWNNQYETSAKPYPILYHSFF